VASSGQAHRVSDLQVPLTDDRTTYPYEWLLQGAIDCASVREQRGLRASRKRRAGPRRSTVGATRTREGIAKYGRRRSPDPVNKKYPIDSPSRSSRLGHIHQLETPKYGASRRHWIGFGRRRLRRLPRTSTAADELSGHPVPQVTPPYLTPARGGRCCRLPRLAGSAGQLLAQLRRITP